MSDPRHQLGHWAEDLAVAHLQNSGYEILERNLRYKVGEVDVVAKDHDTLVFVEVRSRSDPEQVHPAATITRHKQRQIIKVAMTYCKERAIQDCMIRFDVVAVLGLDGQLELYQNAFDAGR